MTEYDFIFQSALYEVNNHVVKMWTNVSFTVGYDDILMSYNGNKVIEEKVLDFFGFVCSDNANQYPINDGYWYELIE